MRIYFSGSISGGRQDLEFYRRLVEKLERDGHQVLAGTVTNPNVGHSGEELSDEEIFLRDIEAIEQIARDGGVLVAEVTTPSHGVGYEIAAARYRFDMPVIALHREDSGRRCSAMISGDPGIRLIRYTEANLDDLVLELDEEIACLAE